MTGLIERYDTTRGYGFITPLVGKPGAVEWIFFHRNVIVGGAYLPEGAEVSFDVCRGERGPQAANVKLIKAKVRYKDELQNAEVAGCAL